MRGTNWLGDAVMTTPALLRLREKFPDAQIALLAPEKLRELVDAVIRQSMKHSVFAGRKCICRWQKTARGEIRPGTGVAELAALGN